jgi:hypothetical protein
MRILQELDYKLPREIRDARAKDPLISVVALQEQLEKQFNRTFSRRYVAKLAFKVERQAFVEADRTKLEERMQFTRENYRMMRARLLEIIYWKQEDHPGHKPPLNRDVNEAAKNIVNDGLGHPERRTHFRLIQETNRRPRAGIPLRPTAARGAHHGH